MRAKEFVYLLEDRAEFIAAQMRSKIEAAAQRDLGQPIDSVDVVNKLKQADPDPLGKNLQFIANMYVRQQFKLEDLARLRDSINKFFRMRNTLQIKDLNQIKDLDQLYNLIDTEEEQPVAPSVKQQTRDIKANADRIIDTTNFKVIVPKTEEASCLYGAGTKWCTASKQDNQFQNYASKGNVYIIMANLGGQTRKFQLQMETNSFMNERDQGISKPDIAALSKIPEYTQFLNFLIKKHYGKYLDA